MLGSIAATHERPLEERVRPRLFNARNGVSMSAASHSSRTSPIAEGSRSRLPRGAAPAMDAAVWAISVAAVACLDVDDGRGGGGLAAGSTLVLAVGLHRVTRVILPADRSRLIAIDAIPRLLLADALISAVLMTAPLLLGDRLMPVRTVAAASALALMLHLMTRWVLLRMIGSRPRPGARRPRRVIVLGAGYGGIQAIGLMLEENGSVFQPVAVLDDDPATHDRSIRGVKVMGPWSALNRTARRTRADAVLLTWPASPRSIDYAVRRADALGMEVRVMPSPTEVTSRMPSRRPGASIARSTRVFRPLELTDLLEQRTIDVDVDAIAAHLTGERVLVTGAGGAIGSRLCHEIARYEPERLVMVDRDETALHHVQLSLDGEPMLDSPDLILGDLRSPGFIDALFEEIRPTIVFHAAGLSRPALAERFPDEAFLTNVVATRDLLLAASAYKIRCFINMSTDEAADPMSVLGCSKRVAERLTSALGRRLDERHRFVSVRFGDVLDPDGPMLQALASQLNQGLPMTIADPRVRHFAISTDQACRLVMQAAVMGRSGDALVLDMGEPHDLEEIARRFALVHGCPDAHVVCTRIRPGERTTERLLDAEEIRARTRHPLISRVAVPPVPMSALGAIDVLCESAHQDLHGAMTSHWMESTARSGVAETAPALMPRGMPSAA